MDKFSDLISRFLELIADGKVEIYNEFSFQHEVGVYLRNCLPDYKVQFERNVEFFFEGKKSFFTKRELDVSVFSHDKSELKWAIELKYPQNGQYPEQMYSFCKDIAFAEELKAEGFSQSFVLILARDRLYYHGRTDRNPIYSLFRGGRTIHGLVRKPTGSKDTSVNIHGTYNVEWKQVSGPLRCATIESNIL